MLRAFTNSHSFHGISQSSQVVKSAETELNCVCVKYFIGFIDILDVKGLQHNHMSAHYVTVVKGLVKHGERAEHNTFLEYETTSSSKRSDQPGAESRPEGNLI